MSDANTKAWEDLQALLRKHIREPVDRLVIIAAVNRIELSARSDVHDSWRHAIQETEQLARRVPTSDPRNPRENEQP